MNEKIIHTTDYKNHFWNALRGREHSAAVFGEGRDIQTGGYVLPTASEGSYDRAIRKESLFRNIATVVRAYGGSERIFAKDCEDLAAWVPEGESIPLANGMEDFTKHSVDSHKLAAFVKLDNDFIRDAAFDFEGYLTGRMAKCFARAEDSGFLTGDGIDQPTGLLHTEKGAETGVTTSVLTYDDIVKLYFSVKPEYRRNGVWLMNDETALTLRTVKDGNGNYLWNHSSDTILGKRVEISEYMHSVENGKAPILFGDFRYYWIVLRSPVTVKRITELYVRYDQTGYLAIEFLDGKLIRREAVKALRIVA